jgi:hypothetical protein
MATIATVSPVCSTPLFPLEPCDVIIANVATQGQIQVRCLTIACPNLPCDWIAIDTANVCSHTPKSKRDCPELSA